MNSARAASERPVRSSESAIAVRERFTPSPSSRWTVTSGVRTESLRARVAEMAYSIRSHHNQQVPSRKPVVANTVTGMSNAAKMGAATSAKSQ